MVTPYDTDFIGGDGQAIHTLVAVDSDGAYHRVIVNSDGQLEVKAATVESRKAKAIDASGGAYLAGDVVNDDNCCNTAAAWEFTEMARVAGGYGVINFSKLFNETENQAVQYELQLYNASPSGELIDNSPSNTPQKADRLLHVGDIPYPTSIARGTYVATKTQASPSTAGDLPLFYKCAAGSTSLFGILITRTAYTQTPTDDIQITHTVEYLS